MLEQSFGRWHKFSLGAPASYPLPSVLTLQLNDNRAGGASFLPCLNNDTEEDGTPLQASWCILIPVSPKHNQQGRGALRCHVPAPPNPHPPGDEICMEIMLIKAGIPSPQFIRPGWIWERHDWSVKESKTIIGHNRSQAEHWGTFLELLSCCWTCVRWMLTHRTTQSKQVWT